MRLETTGAARLARRALPYFYAARDNRNTRPVVVVNVAWALVLRRLECHDHDVVFGNVTTSRNGDLAGLEDAIGPCVNTLPTRLCLDTIDDAVAGAGSTTPKQTLRNLVAASAE
ncbi:hypothetical protein F5Y19DRAFT_474671 [Xylariaceae sp. FL1651]|nr:hypothetical protein F5Y19DRAFT_474671 [Xylariaceae sp. FL1651]